MVRLRCLPMAVVPALIAAAPAPSWAQTRATARFQNRLSDLPVTIVFDAGSEDAASEVERAVREAAPEMAREFALAPLPPLLLQLERNAADFRRAAGGRAPDWGAAIAFPSKRVAVFDLTACARHPRGLTAVVRHELSHLLFAEARGRLPAPLWFDEGLAMRQASEWRIGDSWTLLEARLRGPLPSLAELDGGFPAWGRDAEVAYALSMRAVNGIMRSAPRGALADLAARCRTADTFEQAFASVFGYRLEDYAAKFSNELRRTFRWTTAIASIPVLFAFMSLLFLLAYGSKRIRARRILRRWAEEDRANPAPVIPFPFHRAPGTRPADPGQASPGGALPTEPGTPPPPPEAPRGPAPGATRKEPTEPETR